ncbi:MAG: TIGR03960 family B12-binding radical SAM protein [candidate division KSB1 bacterium]|nr:TIGR03960 family B12-binding radical SAM protein [candidate division KSB1 bacterium]
MNELDAKLNSEIFPLVNKPGRYIGNEINVIKKDWSNELVKYALIFPDLYEIGMSHIGFEILYHILNQQPNALAERVYAPAADMEEKLRATGLPLFSLESKQPLQNFDVLGFTLQYELHYTNVLNILDLAGLPILSQERDDAHPLVIAGGPCAFNPEPLADFIDAFVIGDGEELVVELTHLLQQAKSRKLTRNEILSQMAQLPGIYVPQFYQVQYDENGRVRSVDAKEKGLPQPVVARTIEELKPEYYPLKPLVPLIETTHDRYSVEIMRGCTQGCRFCNAGVIYRPVRERPVEELVQQVTTVVRNTGYDEISLASLSTSDYSQILPLLDRLTSVLEPQMVNVSFPSLRTETFSAELARHASKVKKSGLTLAPEAGTERLRNVINKTNSNADLLRSVEIAFNEGWDKVKLYFMIGQPGETDDDLDGIVGLIREALKIAHRYKRSSLHISISPFSPKPQTPFQWAAQDSISEIQRKVFYLKDRLPQSGRMKLNWREPEVSFLEGIMARGDRRLGAVIARAWQLGARFDAWSEQFRFDLWEQAFQELGIATADYTRQRELNEVLPWDHISKGVSKDFLKREYQWALEERITPDCRDSFCHACGMMSQPVCEQILFQKSEDSSGTPSRPAADEGSKQVDYGRIPKKLKVPTEPAVRILRLKYEKKESIRFTSHLDLIRIFERSFRRASIKLVYSQGFHPHPKIAYGPPLAMGFTSAAEYLDLHYYREQERDIKLALNRNLPAGLQVLDTRILYGKPHSLTSIINRAEYQVKLHRHFDQSYLTQVIAEFLQQPQIVMERIRDNGAQQMDIRPFIERIAVDGTSGCLLLSLNFINGKTVRVQEVLNVMLGLTDEEIALSRIHRNNLFIQYGDLRLTPMEI